LTERIRQNVIIPQVNEPLGLVDGKPVFPTTAWHQYFDGLWKRTGGFSDGLLEQIVRSFVETSENRAAIEAVTGRVRSLEELSQSNAEEARQAVQGALDAVNAARDNLRAETESAIASAVEAAAAQARVANDTARAEAQAELAVALEDSFARLRRVEDNLRAEVEATLAGLGELARTDVVQRGNIASGAVTNNNLASDLTIRDSTNQPILERSTGKLFVGGYELYRTFSQSGSSTVTDANSTGKVLRRVDPLDVRARNSWALFSSQIVFGTHSVGTMTAGETATFRIELWITGTDASPIAVDGNFGSLTAAQFQERARWTVVLDHLGAVTITNQAGNPITATQLNQELASLTVNYPAAYLGDAHMYLVGRWISSTASPTTGIVFNFTSDTTLAIMALINVTP
jgi:hypothetical protein